MSTSTEKYTSEKVVFEHFAKLDASRPIRIIPEGTWYRGDRTLEITENRLKEAEVNFAKGLPNFRVPLTLNHEDNAGKIGDIKNIAYLKDGPSGSGLYATEYEFTDKGQKAADEDGYDAVSAEIVWTLNDGAKYQDPRTGNWFDNVVVGVTLTPYPFFGHDNVALYSAKPPEEKHMSLSDEDVGLLRKFINLFRAAEEKESVEDAEEFRDFSAEERRRLAKEGKALPDGSFPIVNKGDLTNAIKAIGRAGNRAAAMKHIKKRARALGATDMLPEDWRDSMSDELENVEEVEQPTDELTKTPEKEDFISRAEVETLRADDRKKIEEMEAKLEAAEKERMEASLRAEVEAFEVLPIKKDEYVEKMQALPKEAAKWVKEQFEAFDVALREAGVLKEIGSDREGEELTPERATLAVIKEQFEGDMTKWSDALAIASQTHPELFREYRAQ